MTLPDGVLRACVDRIDSEFAIVDADGTILYTNEAWQRFAVEGGLPGDPAMIGENYFEAIRAVREEDRFADAACEGFETLAAGERDVFRLEYPCPGPGEPFRWFLLWASSVSLEGSEYVVVEHIEITERKRAETRLEHRNEMLEAVGSILSHDIRNPMAAAVGWGQAIKTADEPNPDHIERMVGSLERMDRMVDDAVFLARGTLVEETESIDLGALVAQAWDAVAPETATLIDRVDVCVDADPTLLQTLFENLFRNAVEHGSTSPQSQAPADAVEHGSTGSRTESDDTGGASSSEPSVADAPEDAVEHGSADVAVTVGPLEAGFFVEDDGPGIPESERDTVFETGHTSRSTATNTGMGLAIVEAIAHAHDWEIELTAADAGGARFEVTGVRTAGADADFDTHPDQ